MKTWFAKITLAAAFVLALVLTFGCSADENPGGKGTPSKTCISDGLKISANTLDDIRDDCGVSRSDILSLLPDDFGDCDKNDLDFGKPIRDIMSDCDVDVMPIASSSSGGDVGGGNSSSSSSSGNDGGNSSSSADVICPSETVKIDTQCWMKKNLDVEHKAGNGDSYCYGNTAEEKAANCAKYGRLYNWAAAMNLPSGCNYKYKGFSLRCVKYLRKD